MESRTILASLRQRHAAYTRWRHHLHAHPELAFREVKTSDFVAARLAEFGLEVHRGLATTGVVGSLRRGGSQPAMGLRADLDALPIVEENQVAHRSRHEGLMHACGHDGHMTMLLAAAECLSQDAAFAGNVHFIFQPAEENEGGAKVMIEEGLFDLFPVAGVFGLHNFPGITPGHFAVKPGAMMASFDTFDLELSGNGTHAAMPERGHDVIVAASQLVTALQTIVSRRIAPSDTAVVSVGRFQAGSTYNVLPERAELSGCCRSFSPRVRDAIEKEMGRIVGSVAEAHGVQAHLRYHRSYPATINTEAEAHFSAEVAEVALGSHAVDRAPTPSTTSEDFGCMLESRPGAFAWIGNGEGMLHSPHYDFDDRNIPLGAAYWVQLAHRWAERGGSVRQPTSA